MKIDLSLVPVLWYENVDGERHVPSQKETSELANPPPGFVYQNNSFPCVLHQTTLKIIQADEVAACEHPLEKVRPTYGWIDGVEGRKCTSCRGTQMRNVGDEWPETWEAYGSQEIASGSSSWSEDLVLSMASHFWWRYWKVYRLSEAILIVANACERCLNVLGHRYGMKWGYAEDSEEWQNCRTECQFCKES